jgi:hypothetical protein
LLSENRRKGGTCPFHRLDVTGRGQTDAVAKAKAGLKT